MDCVNHPGMNAEAYCQNCGKAMCATCVRREPTGEVMCEPCWTAWQAARAPFAAPYPPVRRCPSPVLAAVLGFIPGVGAMFNGQFVKGFLHVIVFAVLVSMTDVSSIFGLLIAAWIFYQVFDAFNTARAICEGQPLPDPLGLNELVNTLGREYRRSQSAPPPPPASYAPRPRALYPAIRRRRLLDSLRLCRQFHRSITGAVVNRLRPSSSSPWACSSCWDSFPGARCTLPGRYCSSDWASGW